MLSHLGEDEKINGAVTPPLFQNSLFLFDSVEELHQNMALNPEGPPWHYSRIGNPTVSVAEQKIAALEGAETCKLIGTGQGAIALAFLSELEAGAHVVAVDTCYGPVKSFLSETLHRYGVAHTLVDGRCPDEILDAIRPDTKLIYLESPSSLIFRLQDVAAITNVARQKGVTTAIDNTYNTPIHFNPIQHGVDIVCHSATKYMGGHSDVTAGVICTDSRRMKRIIQHELNYIGSILHPFSAWLLTRGLRTLPLRIKQHEATGNRIAQWIEDRPEVASVNHISLASYAQRELFARDYRGSGGLFSFEPKQQDKEKIYAFCNHLQIFGRGVSWGGFESLAIPIHVQALGMSEPRWLIRLFCGLEEPEDLIKDLSQAFGYLA